MDTPFGPTPARAAAEWDESIRPGEMLELARGTLGERYLERHAPELRRFACWCARQYPTPPGRTLVQLAEQVAAGQAAASELAAARARQADAATEAAVHGLTDHRRRAEAAGFLAAFHTLHEDPFLGAVQAARVTERYASGSEAEAESLRRAQAEALRSLLGNPFQDGARSPCAAERPPRPWRDVGRWNGDLTARLRALHVHREALLALDPWIAVPQEQCTFGFGFGSRPLPLGALVRLWDGWGAMRGRCPSCGGDGVGYSFGLAWSNGGVRGVCLVCERELVRSVGGLATLVESVRPHLEGTPFHVEQIRAAGEPLAAGPEELDAALATLELERVLEERG